MKKILLFFAAVAAISLASCGGGDASSVPDGNSQDPGIDPNAPGAMPPQMNTDENTTNAPTVEENNTTSANKDSVK